MGDLRTDILNGSEMSRYKRPDDIQQAVEELRDAEDSWSRDGVQYVEHVIPAIDHLIAVVERRCSLDRDGWLVSALKDLVSRCDGDEGVRADGSNIQTIRAHAAIERAETK